MAGYVRGSAAHLDKLLTIVLDNCNELNKRSEENSQNTDRILEAVAMMYRDFASRWAAMNANKKTEGEIVKPFEKI